MGDHNYGTRMKTALHDSSEPTLSALEDASSGGMTAGSTPLVDMSANKNPMTLTPVASDETRKDVLAHSSEPPPAPDSACERASVDGPRKFIAGKACTGNCGRLELYGCRNPKALQEKEVL